MQQKVQKLADLMDLLLVDGMDGLMVDVMEKR